MKQNQADVTVLALNSGSSSLKFAAFRTGEAGEAMLLSGSIEGIGKRSGSIIVKGSGGDEIASIHCNVKNSDKALTHVLQILHDNKVPDIDVVVHRIVHGGPRLTEPCVIDQSVLRELKRAVRFDPLHAGPALELIAGSRKVVPDATQIACFDTSFHSTLAAVARTLPLPKKLRDRGIRRYGFHGLSCESIVAQLPAPIPSRLIIAHLGSGSSVTAVRDGRSVDTSMGMSSSGGVIMGTRTGDLDPGVLLYLMQQKRLGRDAIERLINHQSGLLGISGSSSDVRDLHRLTEKGNAAAALATDMFCRSVCKQIAAMIPVLDGVDLIVFTGGIGEADAVIRMKICESLCWLGIRLDASANVKNRQRISVGKSACDVWIIPAREELVMARHAVRLDAEARR